MYGVETRVLNQAVKRHRGRFPADFAFQLTGPEIRNLRSQIVISSLHGGRRYRPWAFTEHGVAMLSSVLQSRRAVRVNVAIMRAFVRLREVLSTHRDLARRIDALQRRYDGKFAVVFDAIRRLMSPPALEAPRRRIGFALPSGPESPATAPTRSSRATGRRHGRRGRRVTPPPTSGRA